MDIKKRLKKIFAEGKHQWHEYNKPENVAKRQQDKIKNIEAKIKMKELEYKLRKKEDKLKKLYDNNNNTRLF